MRGGGSVPSGRPWVSGRFCLLLLSSCKELLQGPGLLASLLRGGNLHLRAWEVSSVLQSSPLPLTERGRELCLPFLTPVNSLR